MTKTPAAPTVHASETWMLVGQTSKRSLFVRGGEHPVAIEVSHPDTGVLLALLRDANKGAGDKST